MDDRLTKVLKLVAIAMVVGFLGWALYDRLFVASAPGDLAYYEANTLFEDGFYERAAAGYRDALAEAPDHLHALRGLARSLHQTGAHEEALALYDETIALEPDAASYANRGILLDTMGRHEEALADYMVALDLDNSIADGPHWLTRFLRNQADAPPTVADRAAYLRAELAKPESERVLLMPDVDQQQRPYKQ